MSRPTRTGKQKENHTGERDEQTVPGSSASREASQPQPTGRLRRLVGTASTNAPRALGWAALVLAGYVLGNAAQLVGVPAAHLLISLAVGAAAALSGLVRSKFPAPVGRGAQALVGVLMGSYLDPGAVRQVVGYAGELTAATIATIALCLAVALVLPRIAPLPRADAFLGMVPGGSAAIVSCADELDADARTVSFMQYFRVALVAASAPLVVLAVGGTSHATVPAHPFSPGEILLGSTDLVTSAHPMAGLTALVAVCALGTSAGRRFALPAPMLLGPMVLAGIATFTGAAGGFTPEGLLRDLVFVVVGLEVGLRFTRASVVRVGRCLPHVLLATSVVCTGGAALAAILSGLTGIPFVDAYLATTPGGINAVLAAAAATHGNLALISTAQGVRLFTVVLLVPPLIRRYLPSSPATAPPTTGHAEPEMAYAAR